LSISYIKMINAQDMQSQLDPSTSAYCRSTPMIFA